MPQGTTQEAGISREQLRTFHLAGRELDEYQPKAGLRAGILGELTLPALESAYPVWVAPGQAPRSLADVLGESPYTAAAVASFRAAIGDRVLVALHEIKDAVIRPAGLPDELARRIPATGWLVSFSAQTLPLLYGAALAAARQRPRAQFFEQLKQCVARLQDLLASDDAHPRESPSSQDISAALGTEGREFFKPDVLEHAFRRSGPPARRMDAERRARCEATLKTLEDAVHDHQQQPVFWLFHFDAASGPAPSGVETFGGRCRQSADPCGAALEFCDQQLRWLVGVLRAMRIARLEAESSFDPTLHAPMLGRFDWQTADARELDALPAVVVMEPAGRLAKTSLASFARLLRSGRPVQILVPSPGLYVEDLSGVVPDFAYLAVAHREAFVVQSSVAHFAHLAEGLAGMTRTLRPAVAVVCVPENHQRQADQWLEISLCSFSRAFPLYLYDPDRGSRWPERFQLWEPGPAFAGLTAAHAAALSEKFRSHFRVIPASQWDDEQMELGEYLSRYQSAAPLAIPYLWVIDESGERLRAAVTRELVNLCRDRARAWEIFAELAGARPEQKAPEAVRAELEQARREGAMDAIHRTLAMLDQFRK